VARKWGVITRNNGGGSGGSAYESESFSDYLYPATQIGNGSLFTRQSPREMISDQRKGRLRGQEEPFRCES
jgi:hypothetical protein